MSTCRARSGWFTTKYPVSLTVGGLDWAQVVTGDAALGPVIKDAKEQLRALPDRLTYGAAALSEPRRRSGRVRPGRSGSTISGGWAPGADAFDDLWQISQDGMSLTAAATAVPMPLAHTVALNAGTVDTDAGPQLHANWTWAPSALNHAQVSRLSQLWFDALTGICAHVRGGGGGLTPSDIAPARLSQQQIDELHQQYEIADVLPLTPLQQGLLFLANTARGGDDDVYAVQLDIHRDRPARPPPATRRGAHRGRPASESGRPLLRHSSTSRCRSSQLIRWRPGAMSSCAAASAISTSRSSGSAPRNAPRSATCRRAGLSGGGDPHRRKPAPAGADQSPHRDGRVVAADPAEEIFASYYGQRLPAPAPYRRLVTWLADQDRRRGRSGLARGVGRLRYSHLGPPGAKVGAGRPRPGDIPGTEQTTRALGELARSCHTTVNTVLQGALAQLLMWLTGQHDVAFGTAVSGRPAEVVGAESMVGLLINTVPVRATITAATTAVDLLEQLQGAHNDTLEHQHLALPEIHRITGHDQLFDTLFVYENYPIDTAALSGDRRAGRHRVQHQRIQPLPADGASHAGPRTGPSCRIRHRRFRRGRHRGADRAVAAGVGGDDRRPDPSAVIGGCPRCR